jgi:nucleotide-binding universal stress UspA family protein
MLEEERPMNTHGSASTAHDVVVGVDGSAPSTRALIWAIRLAASRGWTVEAVTAWPEAGAVLVHDVPGHFSQPRQRACTAQESALADAQRAVGGITEVDTVIVNAHPVVALRERAAGARLLIVGGHEDPRPRAHASRPAVGDSLAGLIDCPLVVIQDEPGDHDLSEATAPTQEETAS